MQEAARMHPAPAAGATRPARTPQATRASGLLMAAGSGLLYGLVNVLAKPVALDATWKTLLLYAASAAALSPFLRGLRIQRGDRVKFLVIGFFGGGLAPVLLLLGLQETAATDAGFLLTTEMVATAVLGFVFLRERFRWREVAGLGALLATAATIATASADGAGATTMRGAILVLSAALAWGVDNAVSTRLVGTYRVPQVVAAKGVVGAACALVAVLALRPAAPLPGDAMVMVALGVVSIAFSSLLFYTALRRVGAGRTSAMNIATTALIGALGGWLLLHETLRWLHAIALLFLALGAALLWRGHETPGAAGTPNTHGDDPPGASRAKGS